MSILSPTNLETADYGTTGWNNIYSTNFQKLNDYLAKFKLMWDNTTKYDNDILVYNSSTGKWDKTLNITNVKSITANYTLSSSDSIILVDATAGNVTITVGTSLEKGKVYTIKKIDSSANTITLSLSSGTIDGNISYTLTAPYEVVRFIFDGANFYVV